MKSKMADQEFDTLDWKALHVAHATARQPAYLRASMWFTEVGRHLALLSPQEPERANQYCGFLTETGWRTLSKTMEILNGQGTDTLDAHAVHTLHHPARSGQGWVRIFRSTHVALSKTGMDAEVLMDAAFRNAQLDLDSQDWVKGIWGLPAQAPIAQDGLREAILASDLFSAPWMVAVWKPDTQWVVEGIAASFLREGAIVDASNPLLTDLFTLQRGDQVAMVDNYGDVVPGTGPALGIQAVIASVELALRHGWRLDLRPTAFDAPVDAWEDGIPGFGETQLMGVVLSGEDRSWLLAFSRNHEQWKADGFTAEDLSEIQSLVGFDPSKPLLAADIKGLLAKGTPVWARIPSFLRVWG